MQGSINRINKLFRVIINNKVVANATWIIVGRIGQMILSFIVGIMSARYLGPSNYGIINYSSAYVVFFSSIASLGINSIIIKEFIDNPKDHGKAIGTTLGLRLIAGLFSILLIVLIVSIVDKNEPTTLIVVVIYSSSLIFQIFDTFNYWFQSRYQSRITALAIFIAYLVVVIYRVILLITEKNVVWFAFASSLDFLVYAILIIYAYKRNNGPTIQFSIEKAKVLLKNSYHYILSGIMVAVYSYTDKFMLKQMIGEIEVGYYAIAFTICSTWVFILQAIIDSMYPTIIACASASENLFEIRNRQLYAMVFYISVFVSIIITCFSNQIVIILYGTTYEKSISPLKVMTWYIAFSYLGVARNSWLVSKGVQRYLKSIYAFAAVENIGFNLLLIPLWGATGAAYASLITNISTSIIFPLLVKDLRPNAKLMLEAILLRGISRKIVRGKKFSND